MNAHQERKREREREREGGEREGGSEKGLYLIVPGSFGYQRRQC